MEDVRGSSENGTNDDVDAFGKNRMDADAVISCWQDIMDGTFMKKGGGKPKQMTLCSAQRTNSSIIGPDYFVEDHPMPVDILAGVAEHSEGLIGTHKKILQHNRDLYKKGHKEAVETVNKLLKLARLAADEPDEVITSKTMEPPTGDKRTYMSLATYCWPSNPEELDNPQGPWSCTDGKAFPGRNVIAPDFMMLVRLFNRVYKISMAYYFTGNERWAKVASRKIRKFFLDEETGMLPTLLYAQLKPGMSDVGAPTGTIDMKNVYQLFDSITMMHGSKHWSESDDESMQVWMGQYVEYLDSEHVQPERKSINNHGTYYDLQYVSVLRYLGRLDEARHYLNTNGKERLRLQIRGAMLPNELVRPKSYAYHNFELEAYVRLALQAEQLNVDLWTFRAEEYNSILVCPSLMYSKCLCLFSSFCTWRNQDAWDHMGQHWCDRSQGLWPVEQMDNPPLEIYRPANFMGALYNKVHVAGAYTLRSLYYAELYQQFRTGHDPHNEMDWDTAVVSQLPLVHMDNCFMTLCPHHKVLNVDPPAFEAPCAPLHAPIPALSALAPDAADVQGMQYICASGVDTCMNLIVPLGILLMFVLTCVGWLVHRRYKGLKRGQVLRRPNAGTRSAVAKPLLKLLRQTDSRISSTSTSSGASTDSSPVTADSCAEHPSPFSCLGSKVA